MSKYHIPLNVCTYGEEEIAAAVDVLKSTYVTMGEHCRNFEIEFADKMGVKEAVYVNSGSSANLLAWFALTNPRFFKPTPKWEVIVPAVSWATTYWPIVQAGGTPVLVDCDPTTFQIDVDAMRRALTKYTVAVCPVHVLGNAADMTQVMRFAKDNNLIVFEDTCEALGTEFDNQLVGTFGHVGTYSFFFSHHITSIEGGMIVTDSSKLADVMRMMRAHGWSRSSVNRKQYEAEAPTVDPNFFFVTTGFNLRPTEINAVIGRIQLRKLSQFNDRRNEIAEYWNREFAALTHIFRPMEPTSKTTMAWFGYPVLCADRFRRDSLKAYLETKGIETRPIVSGNIARHPAITHIPHRIPEPLHAADAITDRGLLWGLHPKLADLDAIYVKQVIKEYAEGL